MPNYGQMMPMNTNGYGMNVPRANGGPVSLSSVTGPVDGILSQTGLPVQLSSITNPLSQTLNGLLNPIGLLQARP